MTPQLVPLHSMVLQPPKPGQLKQQLVQQQRLTKQSVQKSVRKRDRLLKVLDILQELGVIHLVDSSKLKVAGGGRESANCDTKNASTTKETGKGGASTGTTNSTRQEVEDNPNPVYCFGNGVPRMDVILPSQILSEIKEAGEEVLRMKQRIEILKKALHVPDNNTEASAKCKTGVGASCATTPPGSKKPKVKDKRKSPIVNKQKQAHNILKQLFKLHPEIARDPVYAAALRMFRVNVGTAIDHHRIPMDNTPEMDKVITAGINFNAGRFGAFRKRTSLASFAGGSGPGGGGEGSMKKKKKKGRPPKNANIMPAPLGFRQTL